MTATPFRDLLDTEGVREECELRGRVGFMAYHGGALEEFTDVIAAQAAEASDASYYGVLQPAHLNWHISSHKVSPAQSPMLQAFIDHVQVAITIHGFGRHGMWTTVLLGGQNRELAAHVAEHLRPQLPDYHLETDLHRMPHNLRGLHHANPVNLPPGKGVQVELPPRVRGAGPLWKEFVGPGPVPHAQALIDGLAAAARAWTL
jgi:phage replication-related protein YjqB (UPF0714/DUF867 family)